MCSLLMRLCTEKVIQSTTAAVCSPTGTGLTPASTEKPFYPWPWRGTKLHSWVGGSGTAACPQLLEIRLSRCVEVVQLEGEGEILHTEP